MDFVDGSYSSNKSKNFGLKKICVLTSESNSFNLNLHCRQIISEGRGFESCPNQNIFLFNFL